MSEQETSQAEPVPPAALSLAEKLLGTGISTRDGFESIEVSPSSWHAAALAMRDVHGFSRFIDLTCIDRLPSYEPDDEGEPASQGHAASNFSPRFEVHLLLYSMSEKRWARLVTRVNEKLPSVVDVFVGSHNYEREVFDLFGVAFDGHPQLTRILMPDAWKSHPLRRDHPLVTEAVDFTITRNVHGS